jgi:hypothetical protein
LSNGFDLKYYDESASDFLKNNSKDNIVHYHESIVDLQRKFGKNYPVISVKRDPLDSFISMWKHIINVSDVMGLSNLVEIFTNLKINDILTYTTKDVLDGTGRFEVINRFLNKNGLKYGEINENILALLNTMIIPQSIFHNNDDSIIWFDLDNLNELERWVSEMIGVNFKLEHLNSSKRVECSINKDVITKNLYENIYGLLNNPKINKTLI